MRVCVAWLAVLVVVFGGLGAGVSSAVAQRSAEGAVVSEPPGDLGEVGRGDARWQAGQRRAREREERRRGPAAQRAREESRTELRGLGREEALALAREHFPDLLRGRLFSGREPGPGMEVVEQLGGGRAVVLDNATGRKHLALSSVALQAKTQSGSFAPLDLSLSERAGRLVARNPGVAVDFPVSGVPGVALPERSFGLALADGQPRRAQVAEDRVFYASTLTDTDVFAGATPSGAEVALQLRSPQSPERFVFDVEMPDGAVVRRARTDNPIPGDPPQSLEIVRGDAVLGYVRPPQAHDADGQSLAADMGVEGGRIILDVSHRDGDVRYPALVDPEVVHVANRYADYRGWHWSQQLNGQAPAYNTNFGQALGDCAYGCHYYTSMPTHHWFNHGAYAHFWLRSPAGTFLARSENHNIGHKPFYSSAFQGIMNPFYSAWEHVWSGFHEYWGVRHDFGGSGEQNYALFGIGAHNPGGGVWTGENKAWASMETNVVFLGDRHGPAAWGNAVNHDWHDDGGVQHVYQARARDHGLGVRGISFTGPPSGAGTVTTTCSGDPYRDSCPRDQDWGKDYSYRLNEGTTNFELYSWDVVGNQSQRHRWSQRIDRTPPRATASGSLWDARDRDDDNRFEGIYNDAYTLRVDASDSHSGVRDIDVLVDGVSQRGRGGYTTARTLNWTLQPDNYTDGEHTIQIVVRDNVAGQAGVAETRHTTKQTFRVVIDRRGDIVHARQVSGSPQQGGVELENEWGRYNTPIARSDTRDATTTRTIVACDEDDPEAGQCGEWRNRPKDEDGGLEADTAVHRSNDPDDDRLNVVAQAIAIARQASGEPAASGPIIDVLGPWQSPPPGRGTRYLRYDAETTMTSAVAEDDANEDPPEEEDFDESNNPGLDERIQLQTFVDATTRLPVKERLVFEDGTSQDVYWTYDLDRLEPNQVPSDFFRVGKPNEPEAEESVEYTGGDAMGSTTDRQTGQAFKSYSLGPASSVLSLGDLCLASGIRFVQYERSFSALEDFDDEALTRDLTHITQVQAGYNMLPTGGTCAVGLGSLESPSLEILNYHKDSNMAAELREQLTEIATLVAVDPQDGDYLRSRPQPITFQDAAPTVAQVVVVDDDETSALFDIGETTVQITGTFDMSQLNDIVANLRPF